MVGETDSNFALARYTGAACSTRALEHTAWQVTTLFGASDKAYAVAIQATTGKVGIGLGVPGIAITPIGSITKDKGYAVAIQPGRMVRSSWQAKVTTTSRWRATRASVCWTTHSTAMA